MISIMVRWNVAELAARRGWTKPYHMWAATGISQPAAKRILAGEELDKIDVPTLMTLHRALKLRGKPWVLLHYEPDPPLPLGKPAVTSRKRR